MERFDFADGGAKLGSSVRAIPIVSGLQPAEDGGIGEAIREASPTLPKVKPSELDRRERGFGLEMSSVVILRVVSLSWGLFRRRRYQK